MGRSRCWLCGGGLWCGGVDLGVGVAGVDAPLWVMRDVGEWMCSGLDRLKVMALDYAP